MGRALDSRSTWAVRIKNQVLLLHKSGALYWEEEDCLLISDVHFGKISHFRKHGSALPSGAIMENIKRLEEVTKKFMPSRILFLGDLFHSALNREWIWFETWVVHQNAEITLIEGNHDIISPVHYHKLGINTVPELIIAGFLLTHHPEVRENYFNLSGHLHPGIKLTGNGRQSLILPCFFKSSRQLILPAFGAFTGKQLMSPGQGDKVYIMTSEEVIPYFPSGKNGKS